MKPPVPPQPSPSQKNLAATVTLGLLMVVFLLIPVLAGRSRGPSFPEQPTVADALSGSTFVGPSVPLSNRPWPNAVEPAWAPSSGFVAQLQKVSLMMLLMSIVIFVTLKATNRFFPGLFKHGKTTRTPLMQVLERQAVAPGINLALVRVGGKTLVLGLTDTSVSTVCELSAEEWQGIQDTQQAEAEAVREAEAAVTRPDAAQVYRGILRQYLGIIPGFGGTKR